MLIAHVSDFHILEPTEVFSGRVDTAAGLLRAVEAINAHTPQPDLVIATGDLVNDATPGQYEHLRRLIHDLAPPVLFVPGNHDERSACTSLNSQYLAPNGSDGAPAGPGHHRRLRVLDSLADDHTAFAAEFDGLIVVGLDTTIPGRHDGRLGERQLHWLDTVLSGFGDRDVLIAQHHPPFRTGIEQMDGMGLNDAGAEAAVLEAHDNVVGVLCGHLHRFIVSPIGNTVAMCAPSTGAQLALELGDEHPAYTDETPSMLLHLHRSGERLVTHVQPIPVPDSWLPHWAV